MNEYNRRKKQIEDSERIAIWGVGSFIAIIILLNIIGLFV